METFQQIINGDKPVLVDFYATWCGPCKTMSPIVEAVGKEMNGQIRVLKIDVDKNQNAAAQFGIQAVPTFIVFKNGKIVWKQAGGIDKYALKQQLQQFL
jgi:thioredoxin 1